MAAVFLKLLGYRKPKSFSVVYWEGNNYFKKLLSAWSHFISEISPDPSLMRHLFLLLFLLANSLFVKAQVQPVPIWNGGFEEWDTLRNNTVSPRNWTTLDTLLTGYQNVTRSTDSYSGKYAVKVVARKRNLSSNPQVSPLLLGSVRLQLNANSGYEFSQAGQPFNYQPDAITCYYKYAPNVAFEDAATIYIECKMQDASNFPNTIVAHASYDFQPSTTYQKITIPTQSISSQVPVDTLIVNIYYYSKDTSENPSGYLIIDDLKPEGALSIRNTMVKQHSIFPNPASNFIQIKDAKPNSTFEVTDLAGRVLLKGLVQNNRTDVSTLSAGLYLLRVSTKEESWVEKLQIQ